ncbi:MAG: CDP-glucose 4,6-dehydratase [Lentimicrobium sp.]
MEVAELLRRTYSGKRVLVTGHTGFKGGWLSIWLTMLGAEVYGFALDPEQPDGIFLASGIGRRIHDFRGDIREPGLLEKQFSEIQPEIVFHLAAQPLVIESYNNPVATFEINTMGTVNLLEAIRKTKSVKAAILITTDKCYENREIDYGYRETDAMGGFDPYSASKGAAEIVISSYRRSFFNKPDSTAIASARAGNVIGGGDWAVTRLVPDIFRSLEKNEPVLLRNPESTRPWQHVLEPLGGYLLLGARMIENPLAFSEAWNFGPDSQCDYTTKAVAEQIISYAGTGTWKDISEPGQLHEALLLRLDIGKAMKKLGWKPVLDFAETIRFTCDWYLNYRKTDVMALTQQQIIKYQKRWS